MELFFVRGQPGPATAAEATAATTTTAATREVDQYG